MPFSEEGYFTLSGQIYGRDFLGSSNEMLPWGVKLGFTLPLDKMVGAIFAQGE